MSYVISMSDVVTHPRYKKYSQDPENGLQAMLWVMGMDINRNVETSFLNHRSEVSGVVSHCERFIGTERKDDEWKCLTYEALGVLC